jgi:hypothetical protein
MEDENSILPPPKRMPWNNYYWEIGHGAPLNPGACGKSRPVVSSGGSGRSAGRRAKAP